jgi:hypothetical protein
VALAPLATYHRALKCPSKLHLAGREPEASIVDSARDDVTIPSRQNYVSSTLRREKSSKSKVWILRIGAQVHVLRNTDHLAVDLVQFRI